MRKDSSELFYAAALANSKIRLTLQEHVKELSFQSLLAQYLVNFFTDENRVLRPYSPKELHAFLINDCVEEEIFHAIERCNEFASITVQEELQTIFDGFESYYNSQKVTKIIQENRENPTDIIKKMSAVRDMSFTSIPVDCVGKLDPRKVREEDFGGFDRVFPTACDVLRRSCSLGNGLMPGQMFQICAAPGCGKSLFLANECSAILQAGYSVYWCALGDLSRWDMLVRMTGITKGIPLVEVEQNLEYYFDDEMKELTSKLHLSAVPANMYSAVAVRNFIEGQLARDIHIDVVFIDYDANFARGEDGFDFLYKSGEDTYNVVASITRPHNDDPRLVWIAAQPKQEYWEDERIPLSASAESSRKQGIVDGMVTIGKNCFVEENNACVACGIISIQKNRRGIVGEESPYVRLPNGLFKLIDKEQYSVLTAMGEQKPKSNRRYNRR